MSSVGRPPGGALDGVRVLDLSWGPVGAIATMVLADHGAEVIRVDRPGGDPARAEGAFATWDRSKRSTTFDLTDPDGLAIVRRLAESADVVVDGMGHGRLDRLGLGFEVLRAANPSLVFCAISAGGDRPEDRAVAHDYLAAARFGVMADTGGHRDGPIFPGHPASTYATALLAVIGTLAALRAALVTGEGDRVDVSNRDGVLALLTMEWWSEAGVSFIRAKRRNGRLDMGRRRLLLEHFCCADGGILQINTAAPGAFTRALEVFGLAARISPVDADVEMAADLTDEDLRILREELPAIIASRPIDHWTGELWSHRVACLPIQPPGHVFTDEQVEHAGVMQNVTHPTLGEIEVVGPVVKLSASPAPPLGPIDRLGASTEACRTYGWAAAGLGISGPTGSSLTAPLADVRILELSSFFASPYGDRLLGDLGADVIKVEPPGGDPQRALPDPNENVNGGKRSIVVDLKSAATRPLVEALVASSDVIQHNMRPGAVERLGLDEPTLRAIRADLVYAYGPGYGSSGPKAGLQSFAPLHSGFTGLMHMAAGEGNPPVVPFGNEDYYAGLLGAVGTLLALIHRDRTGQGQHVEVSQLLATIFVTSEYFRHDGTIRTTLGRLDADQSGLSATLRVYRCGTGWLCVSCLTEHHVSTLIEVVTAPSDTGDGELDNRLATGFAGRRATDWEQLLRRRGVPCEVVRETPWLADWLCDPVNLASGASLEHSTEYGRVRVIGNLFRLGRLPAVRRPRAPRVDEHAGQITAELAHQPVFPQTS